jgi:hypothetical protein
MRLLRWEWRLLGWRIIGVPCLMIVTLTSLTLLGQSGSSASTITTALLTIGLEVGLPLTAALVAATAVGYDPAVELHLSLPVSYRATFFRRLILSCIPTAITAILMTLVLIATGHWLAPASGLLGHLVWIAPLTWLIALVCLLTVLLQSAVIASALIVVLAGAQVLLHDLFASIMWLRPIDLFATTVKFAPPVWWMNRGVLVALGALTFLLTGALLQYPARLLGSE